jgi:gliding motility-associated-like protein
LFNGIYYSESNPQGQDMLTAATGCDSILLIAIELAAPLAEETLRDTLCPGEQLSLLGEIFDENRPGDEILLSSQGGCDSLRIRVDLRFEAPQAGLATEPAPCPGEAGRWQLTAISGGRPPYRFAVDGGPLVPLGNLPAGGLLQPGTYTLRLEDARGCATAEAFNIAAGQAPILELEAEQIELALGDSIRLEPLVLSFSPDSIRWFTTAPISCTDCLTPVVRPLATSRVAVEAYAGNGCLARDELLLLVETRVPVYVPNAFSPNADGRNDFFFPQARPGSVRRVRSLRIYTRWGEPVFENRDFLPNAAEAGWDGTFRGKPLNNGVYVYLLELEYPDGRTEVRSGDVTLVR